MPDLVSLKSFASTDGGGSTSTVGSNSGPVRVRNRWSNAIYQFTQQDLPACNHVLTPSVVITTFFLLGFLFIPVGYICLHASQTVEEIVDRYDNECIPDSSRGNKEAYITDVTISKNCTRYLRIPKYMKAPIYVYYQLDNYYQNHRRYVKSRSNQQLLDGLMYNRTSSCQPEEFDNGLPVVPCGLIAWSLFNDTYSFSSEGHELRVDRKNIAWKSDREHKFGKHVYPFNFQNGTLIGGAKLDPSIPLIDQEDLIVWMRTSALPNFRKLYGRIEQDLEANDVIIVNLSNNYNTYSFGGRKKIVLSTSSWLGGRNDFLGMAYLSIGSSFILTAVILMLLHLKNHRPYADSNYTSWTGKHISS